MMKVVYIFGCFRGPTAWDIECNVRQAEALALEVARLGAMPLCPHTNTRYFHGLLTDRFWLEGTMELARRCDAAIGVSNWMLSAGSREEVRELLSRGTPVLYSVQELALWLRGFHTGPVIRHELEEEE